KVCLPHKSVSMQLFVDSLRTIFAEMKIVPIVSATQKIRSFNKHPLLESCLASLIPYFDVQEAFPEHIASLKITEAISTLRTIDRSVDNILANFDEPYKIDMAECMEKNFMYNMPLAKFSYLTGRSLTT